MTVRRVIALALAAGMMPLLAAAHRPTLEQRIAAERAKAAAMQARLHAKRVELNAATLHYQDLQAQLHETDAAIEQVNGHLDSLAAQTESTQRRITWNGIQLAAARKSLQLHNDLLKRRLVDIYEYGDLNYVNAMIAARSFSEFVERWEDLRLLVAANERAVRARKAAEAHVAAIEADLERTQLQLAAEEQAQEETRSQLGSLAAERSNLVQLAGIRRHSVASQVAEIENLTAAEESQLEGLILERERELASQERAAGIAGGAESEGSHGMFSWPVTGTITSPFGWRSNPFGGSPEFHQGLDIAAPSGTTVTAAAGGTVIMAQWYGGYGNYVLIDHGGSYSTGYGHLSAIYVTSGQAVARGQAIGAVGSTGQSTGPHLHFEVRIAGKPVDPAPRLH